MDEKKQQESSNNSILNKWIKKISCYKLEGERKRKNPKDELDDENDLLERGS